MTLIDLTHKSVVLTGIFVTRKRAEVAAILVRSGAKLSDSISKKTDLLVYGDDAGSKLVKAKSLNVATMSEAELFAALPVQSAPPAAVAPAKKKAPAAATDEKLAEIKQMIAVLNAPSIARLGFTIPHLLRCYGRVFAQRPDVFVVQHRIADPVAEKQLVRLSALLPPDVLALAAELGALELTWVFKDKADERQGFSAGYNGGRINLLGFADLRWHKKPKDWDWPNCDSRAMFDSLVEEANTQLYYYRGQKPVQAKLMFENANDCDSSPMGSVNDYLTQGAKVGFVWYWPRGGYWESRKFTQQLFDKSLPRDTAAPALITALIARGLTEAEAKGMIAWLGQDVVILLPAT